ncbi:MAG: FAD binding domain-containing protein [Planctomycetes bacterium]|nr:FAD binding domain-containing protein [Planctomycetota bacterium]
MMRLPVFRYLAPKSSAEAVRMLSTEGPTAAVVAGGTDLYPNMKRRQVSVRTLVSLRRLAALRGAQAGPDGAWRIGAGTSLMALERDRRLAAERPALHAAVKSISTPVLRTMGTIGGNVLLDTRCNYYDQNFEWRRAVNHCLKCTGDTCWTAPGSDRCWAVNSSDSVPVLIAMGAVARLEGPAGVREVPVESLYRDDGIAWLTKAKDELLTELVLPPPDGWRSHYGKLRRRGTFDFPVLGVATALRLDGDRVAEARIVLNGVGSAPLRAKEAEAFVVGKRVDAETAKQAGELAFKPAKPLDNTDFENAWRKKMVKVYVRDGLLAAARA